VDKSGCVQQWGSNVLRSRRAPGGPDRERPFRPSTCPGSGSTWKAGSSRCWEPHKLDSHTYRKALPRRIEKAAPSRVRAFKEQVSKGYRREVESVLEQTRSAVCPLRHALTGWWNWPRCWWVAWAGRHLTSGRGGAGGRLLPQARSAAR
jgi:hypothetical protein